MSETFDLMEFYQPAECGSDISGVHRGKSGSQGNKEKNGQKG
jgi:hypothetical protein